MAYLNPEFVEACVTAFREHGAKHYTGINWDNVTDREVYVFAQWVARGCPDEIRPGSDPLKIVPLSAEELIAYFEEMEKNNE